MIRGQVSVNLKSILRRNNCRKRFSTSSKPSQESEKTQLTEERHADISNETRKFSNKPFLKNVFAGIYEPEYLVFPESLSKAELAKLDDQVLKVKKFFSQKVGKPSNYDKDLLIKLKEINLIGTSVDQDLGGEDFKATKVLRLFEEISDEGIGSIIYSHNNLGIKCFNRFGSSELKEKFLPILSSGKSFAAFCVNEELSGSDLSQISSEALLSSNKTSYILNGEKSWVINADKADYFVVFAKTKACIGPDGSERVTAFLVEKDNDGITFSQPYGTIDLQNLPVFSVKFNNVEIPTENIIGDIGSGFQVAALVLYEDLFMKGGLWSGILKNLSKQLAEHCVKRKVFGDALKDFGMIQEKMATMAMNIYAIESMSYMTAGLVDSYVQPDVLCESAATKVYASECVWESVKDAMQIMGSKACKMESCLPNLLMNASTYSLAPVTNEILRLYISLNCMQHAALKCQESVRRKRDAFNNVGYVFREGFKQLTSKESLGLKLYDHVHPELSTCGELLEPRIFRLKNLVIKVWTSSFIKFQENQFMLKRFADIAIHLYVINATLARASRSKAIGLKNCDNEIALARLICEETLAKIDRDIETLDTAFHGGADRFCMKVSESMMDSGGYSIEHPLTKNW